MLYGDVHNKLRYRRGLLYSQEQKPKVPCAVLDHEKMHYDSDDMQNEVDMGNDIETLSSGGMESGVC